MSGTGGDVPMRTDSQGPTTLIVAIFFGALTFVVIALRLVARIGILHSVGLDDVLILIAAGCTWAFMVCNIIGVSHGLGDHIEVVLSKPGEIGRMYRIVWISSVFYNASLGFIKCSVLALYARLGDRQLRKIAFIVMAICAASATANVLVCIFQCWPLDGAWNAELQATATCVNINAFYLANAGTNIFTDLLAYLLPMKLVKNLQIPRKQKIAVGVMLCLGLFACVSSIIRISFIPVMLTSDDPTFVIAPPFYWSVIEANIGVLAASIPSFKPLAKRFLPRILGESSDKRTRHYAKDGSYRAQHYKGTSSNGGFSKLSAQDAMHMKVFDRDIDTIGVAKGRYSPGPGMQEHKRSEVSTNVSEMDHGTTTHSNSSEEAIMKPGHGDIMMTTEFTRTVEERPKNKRAPKTDYYPGDDRA
ncbi:uncharacterized protein AB675_1111 [Cyphellophora attinorum]|uniref:Rhodopsin domain-containing protein n=1 Tax=Cyphellophora attinorum TaxID=1664694 RepID=A0A0N0NKM4_9EURO|nr:uncharacterized protein AB675_1111 [Phialophora attinorum]KPI38198.1 hypothetical protein AB675_1111 [Phialophora attinorum]